MQLVHTLFKLILLSETSQFRLHPSLHHSYYKVRSLYYRLLNFGLVQSGLFWVLKSVTAKKHRIKPPRYKCLLLARLLAVRASFLDLRKFLPTLEVRVDSLASIGLWTCVCSPCVCSTHECDVALNLYCNSFSPLCW